MRVSLNANGYSAVKLVADDGFGWGVADTMTTDPAFAARAPRCPRRRHSGLQLTTASTANDALVTQQPTTSTDSTLQDWTIN